MLSYTFINSHSQVSNPGPKGPFVILVLEALSREFRTGVPWELLYADDLAVIADTLEECITKLKAWKNGMENRGLRVNMKKTKFMISGAGLDMLHDYGAFPCTVCQSGVGANSISCSQCKLWVHKKCNGIKGRLNVTPDYVCPRCLDLAHSIDGRPITQVEVDGRGSKLLLTWRHVMRWWRMCPSYCYKILLPGESSGNYFQY